MDMIISILPMLVSFARLQVLIRKGPSWLLLGETRCIFFSVRILEGRRDRLMVLLVGGDWEKRSCDAW